MHKLVYLIFFICLLCSDNLFAQDKFEKESRMKERDVPLKALTFMDSLNAHVKIKWYKEEGLSGNSIEAKFKHQKTKYSIEFTTLGEIEDIEIEVNWLDIELEVSNSITEHLKLDCSKHKIVKVQKQFTGSENDLFLVLRDDITNKKLGIKYEIIVKCNQQKEVNLFEYLFDQKGLLVSQSKIVFKNSSHLEY